MLMNIKTLKHCLMACSVLTLTLDQVGVKTVQFSAPRHYLSGTESDDMYSMYRKGEECIGYAPRLLRNHELGPNIVNLLARRRNAENNKRDRYKNLPSRHLAFNIPATFRLSDRQFFKHPHRFQFALQASKMSTTSLPASEESEEPECAICKETPGPQAIVMPCKHEFDLVCINTWIYSGRAAASACPACRTVMTHIHHSQDDRGNAMCDAVQPSGNYIHDDEEEEEEEEDSFDEDDDNEEDAIVNLSPNHSRESNEGEAENDRRTAFLPRVTLPIRPRNSEAFFEALFVDEWLEVEDHAVNIQRRMGIRILQRDTFTETTLERKLIVRRRELADEISVTETSAEKLALYEVVMKEIGYATEDMAESWRTFRDVGPRFDIMNDRRGLGVRLQRMYVVLKRGRFGEFPREIEVVWKTELKEYISVYADGEVGDSDENLQDVSVSFPHFRATSQSFQIKMLKIKLTSWCVCRYHSPTSPQKINSRTPPSFNLPARSKES